MKKYIGWAYTQYRPPFWKSEIYLCQIIPGERSVFLAWKSQGTGVFEVFGKRSDRETFRSLGTTDDTFFLVDGLEETTDYQFYIASASGKSDIRWARTGKAIGTVVNYLHPNDPMYSFSGQYLCSPCLLRHPDGYLLASMDVYQSNAPQNLAMIFRSDDDGKSWYHVSDLFPCFWPRMFLHDGKVYILACSTEYGDLLIGASEDGCKTVTEPIVLLRGGNGKNKSAGVHKNPQPIVTYHGRIYGTLEWGSWHQDYHASMVMSADEHADLLDPASWSFSEPLLYDPNWEGTGIGKSAGTIEGCLAVGPDGALYSTMRYDMMRLEPCYGKALRFQVDTLHPEAPLIFDRSIVFPANHSKFEMRYDEKTGKYYSIANRITAPEDKAKRTLLSLMSSEDMIHWSVVTDLIDRRSEDPTGRKIGFQYVDFFFEGEDILFLCRTAINGAGSFHDSNYITFHRIEHFRDL